MNHSPRGNLIPQTVESLQEVMAADAVLMEKMGQKIAELEKTLKARNETIAKLLRQREILRALNKKR